MTSALVQKPHTPLVAAPQPARLSSDGAEVTLLGRLLTLGAANKLGGEFEQVSTLKPSDFSVQRNGLVWHAMTEIAKRGDKISLQTVEKQLERPLKNGSGLALDLVGLPHLHNLMTHRQGDINECAKIIRREAFRRKTEASADMIHRIANNRSLTETEIMGKIADEIAVLQTLQSQIDGHKSVSFYDSVGQFWERIQSAQANGEVMGYGVRMGLKCVDDVTQGFQRGKVYVVAGYTGQGKSSFAAKIARAALHQHARVVLIPLEMEHDEMTQRMMAAESGIDGALLMTGRVPREDLPRLAAAVTCIQGYQESQQCVYLEFEPGPTMAQIEAKLSAHMAVHGADIVILDQLSIEAISGPRADSKPVEYLAAAAKRLKELAKIYNVPVIVMAQLNRAIEQEHITLLTAFPVHLFSLHRLVRRPLFDHIHKQLL